MEKFGIGQSLKRREDQRFLTGQGLYTDDIQIDGGLFGFVVRSPYAHARILSIDTDEAKAAAGVFLVLTSDDLKDLGPIPCGAPIQSRDGSSAILPRRAVLAEEKVVYVGEPVAFVVADSPQAAKDAAELVIVDYDPLDPVPDLFSVDKPDSPVIHSQAPDNRCFDWAIGDEAAVDAAFDKAAQVARVEVIHNRVISNPMETRASIAVPETDGSLTLYAGTQGSHGAQSMLAKIMGIEPAQLRVVTPDVGGGFGTKAFVYPEYPLVLEAARRLGKPVRWISERGESFLSDAHGRDMISIAELAMDDSGHFLAYRVRTKANMGGTLSNFAPFIATMAPVQILGGPYKIPAIHVGVVGYFTNSVPLDAYRGAGRPEAAYLMERAVQEAARITGLSQRQIRTCNMVPVDQFPYKNAMGATFDSGDFTQTMDKALQKADYDSIASRRATAQAAGKLRGIGVAYYVECTLGAPTEEVQVKTTPGGRVELYVGTQSSGQGHETTFAQVLAQKLDIDPALVDVKQGDTATKSSGGGTGGSRSQHMIGGASVAGADALIERGRALAAHLFEEAGDQVIYEDGHFTVPATNKRLSLMALNEALQELDCLPEGLETGLDVTASYTNQGSTFPNGCHVAEVEIDPQTGLIDVVNYTIVDDFGVVVNPMIVAGQVHGGVAQGIGQAITEMCHYDEDGQLVTASFMDYGMPRADDMPPIDFSTHEVPCKTNPLGVKGCGEAGTIGALPSTVNAVLDALAPLGVTHIDMPMTPFKVWQAIEKAKAASAA